MIIIIIIKKKIRLLYISKSKLKREIQMAKRISRIVRKQGDPLKDNSEDIFEEVEKMMKINIKRNTINLQNTLNIKHNNFDNEGRGNTNTIFSQAFSELKEDENLNQKINEEKKSNIFGDYFEMEENLQDALLTSYDDKMQKRFSKSINNNKTSLNKQLKECLKIELKNFINNYIIKKNIQEKNIEAMKQTFYELFYSKLLKVLAMIYLFKKDKFFQLVRLDIKNEESIKLYKELEATYKYYNENRKEITNEIIRSFILMLIEFKNIKEEMEFFMDYHFGNRDEVDKLINLEDSLFFSNQGRKDVSFA